MLYQVYSACAEAQTFQKDKLLFSWAHRLISQKFHWSTSFFYVKCEIILWGFVYWKLCNSIFRVFFLFINVETWILTLAETSEAWNSLDVVSYLRHPVWVFFLGFFFTSSLSRQFSLGVILLDWPLLGRLMFIYLWILALTVICWSPKALKITLLQSGRFGYLFSWTNIITIWKLYF